MTLSFSQKFPDKSPTYFVEKIWQGIADKLSDEQVDEYFLEQKMFRHYEWDSDYMENCPAKIHTIRSDEKNRWREGMDIHFVINNRTKNRFQFAPIFPVKKIQVIEVDYCIKNQKHPIVVIDESHFYNPLLGIDKGIEQLAKYDGFESVEKFFEWFSSDFTGKIIHWTDFSY
jgi:hypothetical protein